MIFDEAENPAQQQSSTPKTSIKNDNNVNLRILEKTIITLQNGKIRELKIFGQLLVDWNINNADKLILKLNNQIWEDNQFIQKRVTPNSLDVNQTGPFLYEIGANMNSSSSTKSKSIFDYIVASKHFKIEKIPLMVIYKSVPQEKNKKDVVINIQYKVNENIEVELKDIEFEVNLQKDVFFDDIQTVPPASSFQNHVLLWKVNDFKIIFSLFF